MTAQKQTQTTDQDVDYNSIHIAKNPLFSSESNPFIKFHKPFCKMRRQTSCRIVFFSIAEAQSLQRDFLEYDALYYEGALKPRYGKIPKEGRVIILFLVGNMNIPFTSVRPWTPEKEDLYKSLVGKTLKIVIRDRYDNDNSNREE